MQVLVLSNTYQPLYTVGVEKAITMLYQGRAVSVRDTEDVVRSPSTVIRIPHAIRLLARVVAKVSFESLKPSRQALFRRDRHVCQYCGRKGGDLTVDHVMPRSRGGEDSWENLVAACLRCNNRKGDRTPDEARMPLVRQPRAPRSVELASDLWARLMGW
ncbi:MAG: HNH endonuclease [Candidatus Sericytochromatia bacterium]|nr:HNH endonuclease [Candidatus Sericytochromatia bacterium]